MDNKKSYIDVKVGNKAERRDYSKVSGKLELPNLVEVQTRSYEWFKKEGIKEVFNEIYPIQNHGKSITLNFLDYEFAQPKFTADECKYRESNYCASLKARMELVMHDSSTGEVITKEEEVFLGDFPLMTDTGTFVINGAERVIVSQIVRSPGAYYEIGTEDKTRREIFMAEVIPSRGTWLEYMSDSKKVALGRIINMSIDRKRKVLSTILFKAVGLSLNLEKNENGYEVEETADFLNSINQPLQRQYLVEDTEREFLNQYILLFNSFFGDYEELKNTLLADKTKTANEALLTIYENQRADEIPTIDGAINLMNAKFFDNRRYDLTKTGRYKLAKKLNLATRMENSVLAKDIYDENGELLLTKGTLINKKQREQLKDIYGKGVGATAWPYNPQFISSDILEVPTSNNLGLLGRVVAEDINGKKVKLPQGQVITEKDIPALKKEFSTIKIYGVVIARKVEINANNVRNVLRYGQRLFTLGRLVNEKN